MWQTFQISNDWLSLVLKIEAMNQNKQVFQNRIYSNRIIKFTFNFTIIKFWCIKSKSNFSNKNRLWNSSTEMVQ